MANEQGAPSSPSIDEILSPTFNADAMDHGGFKDGDDQHDDGLHPVTPGIDEGAAGKVIEDEPAPAPVTAAKTPTIPAAAAADAPAPKEPNEPFWYRKALKEQTATQKALEARLADQQRRLDELTQGGQQQERQPGPDPVTDPEAFQAAIDGRLNQVRFEMRLEASEARVRDKHGDAAWEECNDWLATADGQRIGQAAALQRDPCGYAMKEYQTAKLAAEIGNDPEKWRESERQRIRDELAAEFGQDPNAPGATPATPGRPAAPAVRIPGPASTQRSAPVRGGSQAWAGPTPLGGMTKHNFG